MATNCNACGKKILSLNYMECGKCKGIYDIECLNICPENFSKFDDQYKDSWNCPTCTCARPKLGDTSTPIRTLNSTYTNDNVNPHRGCRSKQITSSVSKSDDSTDTDILKLIRQDILEIKSQLVTVNSRLTQKILEYDRELEDKDREINFLKATMAEMQRSVNTQEQNNLKNELEIVGVPELQSENLLHLVLVTSKKLGVDLQDTDIDHVHRAGAPRQTSESSNDKKSRPIVVKLVRKYKRDELLVAARARRGLTSQDLVSGTSAILYFNERLTKTNRKLFGEARKRASQHKFRFCWIRNGNIFVRKEANTKDRKFPAVAISSQEDLDKLFPEVAASDKEPSS